jgi:hypothetical protein
MIQQHELFKPPHKLDIPIWRYMDLAKFLWMLQENALYFCRAGALGDPYEGHYTRVMAESEDTFVKTTFLRDSEGRRVENTLDESTLRYMYKSMLANNIEAKNEFYANCWHVNEDDSQAMWRLYTSHGDAICVKSNYQLLAEELPRQCFLWCINYIDYKTAVFNFGNKFSFIIHKRKSYEHERELRAVVWTRADPPHQFNLVNSNEGMIVPVTLANLVQEILVSPYAKPPLIEVVQRLVKKFDLGVRVRQSEVNSAPTY